MLRGRPHKARRRAVKLAAVLKIDTHAHILPPDSTHYLATPELSFTIRQLRAHGGLNLSASHNPPDDNGGKFYDEPHRFTDEERAAFAALDIPAARKDAIVRVDGKDLSWYGARSIDALPRLRQALAP